MRISDWSSDVCSSDLGAPEPGVLAVVLLEYIGHVGSGKACGRQPAGGPGKGQADRADGERDQGQAGDRAEWPWWLRWRGGRRHRGSCVAFDDSWTSGTAAYSTGINAALARRTQDTARISSSMNAIDDDELRALLPSLRRDRKNTRLNSNHLY